ncbi:MAG: transporter [Roseateles depolymerans]|uniref:Transporter n=1 Tax=Roseateles depolymerans TaxID=76731 RepID=A0A2W5D9H6_9BURK|nr:MAG: transporter [Roseateles depolymerans]
MNKTLATLALSGALAGLLATTGCAVVRDQETVGAYVDDATLTTRVKAKFASNEEVSAMAIQVETLKGTVQLSGFAKSANERDMAEKLARGTPGVVAVHNNIVVRPS